jgi:hypothetical protein
MNIITICNADDWVGTHLTRFVHMIRKVMPDAKLYWLIPILGPEPPELIAHLKKQGAKHFEVVKTVKKQEIRGRLLYYDFLRSGLLDIFKLSEGLYIDPDTDVLEDLSELTTTAPDADLLWVPNVLPMDLVPKALKANNLDPAGPYLEEGFMYMRRSFKQQCEDVLNNWKIDFNSFAPGMEMWNIVARTCNSYMLPQEYNVTAWGVEYFGRAKTIHFTGSQPKSNRMYMTYEQTEKGRRMIIEPEKVRYPDVDLWGSNE